MSFIYLIHSDALWYIYVLLQALLKTWDLDARGHLSVKGKSFCEGAIALCWAGLKLYRLTALKLRRPFLLCITCTWIQNQCKQRTKTSTTLRCRPRQSPKPQLQRGEQAGSSARACPAAARSAAWRAMLEPRRWRRALSTSQDWEKLMGAN